MGENSAKMSGEPVKAVAVAVADTPAPANPSSGVRVPPGAPPGGHMALQQHCGIVTILIGIFLAPCVCCCPCDSVPVYVAPDGTKYLESGAPYQKCGCECVD